MRYANGHIPISEDYVLIDVMVISARMIPVKLKFSHGEGAHFSIYFTRKICKLLRDFIEVKLRLYVDEKLVTEPDFIGYSFTTKKVIPSLISRL